jgi:hypothetical protein
MKPGGLRQEVRLTCKCGQINVLNIDQETLSRYGMVKPPVLEDIYQTSSVPLYRLLNGPRLKALWAEAEVGQAKKIEQYQEDYFKDKPMPRELLASLSAVPDLISVSMNPYATELRAREAVQVMVGRLKAIKSARPWSIELYENIECAIYGLLGAPYFIFLGMTGYDAHKTYLQVVQGLRSNFTPIGAGAEWEIASQGPGNQWRGDRWARLLERWVFLDEDEVRTFGTPPPGTDDSPKKKALFPWLRKGN